MPLSEQNRRKSPSYICKIFFDNEAIEFIDLPSILHDPVFQSDNIDNFDILAAVFNLDKHIHSRIFNIEVDRFLQDNTIISCNCERSKFIDQHHKHMVHGLD